MIRLLGWMSALVIMTACNDSKPAEITIPAASPVYYFYPKANVYHDTANQNYVFLGSNGTSWQTQKDIPAAMRQLMDKSALIDTPSNPVWRDNENHRLVYGALLYATASDTQEVKPPVVITPVATDTVVKKREPKGLRKFFGRIFKGNREKKQKDQ